MSAESNPGAQSGAAAWRSFPPFYGHLDLQLVALGDGKCVARLPYAAHFGNSRGEVHGGIVASLLDIVMSQAVRSTLVEPVNIATISMTNNYLAPAIGVLTCHGSLVGGGRRVAFAQGDVTDEQGTVVCNATAAYRILARGLSA
jgi:uncharacterized protein (TIGR00369 family)